MNSISRKFWGMFGTVCAMVYASIGLYYAVSGTIGKNASTWIIGIIIFCVVLSYISPKKRP